MPLINGRLNDLLLYLEFTPADAEALATLRAPLAQSRDALVDEFYRVLLADAGARAVLQDEGRLEGLKVSLKDWLDRLLCDPIDAAWLTRRAAIGRRHVQVGLPQRYMPLATDIVRRHLVDLAISACAGDHERLARTLKAVNKILALELTVMLDSYHADTMTKLRQVERLQAITRLAAGVSHELKNPLGVINTSLLLVRRLLEPNGSTASVSVSEHLERIGRASRQATDMTDQLLDYSRVRTVTRQRVPIAAIVDDTLTKVGPADRIRFERHGSNDAMVFVDPVLLVRVLANLVRNAVHAITEDPARRDVGTVTVRWRHDGDYDVIDVEDDGPGVPESVRDRIFEPLFTTRSRGTGLGLAICDDIVTAHGGTLELLAPRNPGAAFRIRVPHKES